MPTLGEEQAGALERGGPAGHGAGHTADPPPTTLGGNDVIDYNAPVTWPNSDEEGNPNLQEVSEGGSWKLPA